MVWKPSGICHYCGVEPAVTRDHIVPVSVGGPSKQWNLVGACGPCNGAKSSKRGVCGCQRCDLAERLFFRDVLAWENHVRFPSAVKQAERKARKKADAERRAVLLAQRKKDDAKAARLAWDLVSPAGDSYWVGNRRANSVCSLSSDGQHKRAHSGMGNFCVCCSEILD